jgi:membrane-associated phospholipid phosphatase
MTYAGRAVSPPRGDDKLIPNLKAALIWFPAVALAIALSKYFVDGWIAVRVMQLLDASDTLSEGTSDIPDLLTIAVIIICGFSWGRFFVLWRRGTDGEQMQSCRVIGTAVPLAFFLKWPLKFAFGRANPRTWLESRMSDKFHWFQTGEHYESFPSGHMLVFAALFTALWLFYPRYRSIFAGLALLLAAALVATDYHFMSDVIAGAYLGLLVTVFADCCFEKIFNRKDAARRSQE